MIHCLFSAGALVKGKEDGSDDKGATPVIAPKKKKVGIDIFQGQALQSCSPFVKFEIIFQI